MSWEDFWSTLWLIVVGYALVVYIIVLFSIVGDLFRDHKLNGFFKVPWIIAIFIFPFITAFVYLIARGRGMAERQAAALQASKQATDEYIKSDAGTSMADEIAKARGLLDSGAITQAEYEALKAKQLA